VDDLKLLEINEQGVLPISKTSYKKYMNRKVMRCI
jgi:hypothetical protein